MPGNRVLVLNADSDILSARTITPGLSNWQFTEVTGGLDAGTRIVTSLERDGARDGAHVRVEPPTAGAKS